MATHLVGCGDETHSNEGVPALSQAQISQFIQDGFVRIDGAFPRALANAGREILWRETGCDPDDSSTWTKPVVRLGDYSQEPFRLAANTPVLHRAFDQLVGAGKWERRVSLGTFPVRFPSAQEPADTGWHIDASFGYEHPDFMEWRANIRSKGRALLMLFLFSDVGEEDAPTRIKVGSHHDVARLLAPAGEAGLTLRELNANGFGLTPGRSESLATGEAGTVYLCHPFLVHAAQAHRGTRPRFMAQPPLYPKMDLGMEQSGSEDLPMEIVMRKGER